MFWQIAKWRLRELLQEDLFILCLYFGESSDGTRAQIACPTAAAGGGVGAERTGSDGATNQSRGEESILRWRIKPEQSSNAR